MSESLSAQRDRIQQQVKLLEHRLNQTDLELLSSETDDVSDDDDLEDNAGQIGQIEQCAAGLVAQRDQIQKEIQNLEDVLGPLSPISVSDDDDSSSDESELGLSLSVDSCLQMNLVYQQVVQETLNLLETQLTHNQRQQKKLVSQLSGPIRESPREQPASSSSYQQPISMYLGHFLKPYFKDKLTGLGPPANQETKEKASRMTGCLDDRKLKVKRWESWQKTLLIHSVSRDSLRKLIQPKLSKVDYLTQKLSSAEQADRQLLREQIDSLEREMDLLRGKKEEELISDRYEEHDWQKISNIDFEGTKDAEDIRRFWQNFLHPSINKTRWSPEEVQHLKEVSRRHGERHWDSIADELGTGRTAFMCLQMFQRFVSNSLRRCSWTPCEDVLLRELVDKMRIGNFIPYTQMSYFMEGRDPAQLIYRWNQVLDPSLKRGPWTKEEDQLLLRAVSRYGEKNWWKIRLEVPGRTDSSCRDRYHDSLKAGMKRGAFDRQERELLLKLVEKHGVGRWAKIAAEIPHRFDAQCLREWKKLCRPPAKKPKKAKKQARSPGEKTQKATAKRNIRRRLKTIKEEEESSEEEEMVIPYMDSDDEKTTEVEERTEEKQEDEEEEYSFPPMQDWVPAERAETWSFLSFRLVLLPSSADVHSDTPVRSTVVGKSGRSTVFGPPPRELQQNERRSSSAMMMVTPDQLRAHLHRQAHKFNNQSTRTRRRVYAGQQPLLGRVTDIGMGYKLQAAVTPWIGNLLIPVNAGRTAADVLRECGEKKNISSTAVFLLLLQATNVDVMGCKEMIEQRKSKVVMLTPPPDPDTIKLKDPKTVAGMLQQREAMTEELRRAELQQPCILQQLHAVQQQRLHLKQQQQLVLLQQPQPHPALIQPVRPPQHHPGLLLLQRNPQMPPYMIPQMPPQIPPQMPPPMPPPMPPQMPPQMPPRAVFVPRPIMQQLLPSSPAAPLRLPAGEGVNEEAMRIQRTRTLQEAGEVKTSLPQSAQIQIQNSQNMVLLPAQTLRPMQLAAPPPTAAPLRLDTPLVSADSSSTTPSCLGQGVSLTQNLSLDPPPYVLTNHTAPFPNDHDYYLPPPSQPSTVPKQPNTRGHCRGRKRERGEEPQLVTSSQDDQSVGRTGTSVVLEGKRVRKQSQKARALQEAAQAKAEAKKKRTSSSPRQKRCRRSAVLPLILPAPPPPGCRLFPGQSMWVMTPAGLVQLAEAPPQGLAQPLVLPLPPPHAPQAPPPLLLAAKGPKPPHPLAVSVPINLPLPALPTCHYKPRPSPFVPNPAPIPPCPPPPPPKRPLPYKGTVRVDPAEPPPVRREALQFDPTVMFLEPQEQVRDWLSGKGGVSVPGAGVALPYLPPFVSSLSTLSALLRSKKSLTKASLQLLCRGSEPRHAQTKPTPDTPDTPDTPERRTKSAARQPPPHLPDSTSNVRPSEEQPAPSVTSTQQREDKEDEEDEEATMVAAVRHLVAERFSGNPAYQLLKARFLSCFTVPALLATVHPITRKTVDCPANQEEEEELRKATQRRGQRKLQRPLLLSDASGAPANHFSGIVDASRPSADRTGPDQ